MSSGSTRSSAHDEPPAQTGGRGEKAEARARDPAREGSRRKQLEYWLGHFAQFDLLTDLPNRSQFIDRLEGAIARAVRSKALLGVMLLNLDQFKSVNTTHGLRFGDAVLKRMGERFRECTRTSDSIARLGGDEFSVILEGLESEDGATIAAERMQTALAKPLVIDDRELVVTTTAGIAFHPQHGATVDALLHHADLALSHAKERRRGAWALYSPELALVSRREEERRSAALERLARLTRREREVLDILVAGNANKMIAYMLGTSTRTIENHRARIMDKMEARSLAELMRIVVDAGGIPKAREG
jgi:diguanylate cyclase (GGDEF)-like protein